jgi:L-ascorbate metabolism protein UlaG (beta-lactamase superfamily)
MILLRKCASFIAILLLSGSAWAADLKITYLANEGVLINCGEKNVLLDALLRDSLDEYARHPPDVQEKLETGKTPFDDVQLVLATHFHLDHWDAGAITRFLRNNPMAQFVSTPQATAMMPWSQRERIHALWPALGKSRDFRGGGVTVTAFRLNHGKAQNLGYRISMCGRKLFHLGDADGAPEDFTALRSMGSADVAMVPFWWLLDPKSAAFLRKWRPRYIVAFHFGADEERYAQTIRSQWPEVWVCWDQGETRKF